MFDIFKGDEAFIFKPKTDKFEIIYLYQSHILTTFLSFFCEIVCLCGYFFLKNRRGRVKYK